MQAISYKIVVHEGVMDFVHGGGSTIDEVYIPDLCLYINGQTAFVLLDGTRQNDGTNSSEGTLDPEQEKTARELALSLMVEKASGTALRRSFGWVQNQDLTKEVLIICNTV